MKHFFSTIYAPEKITNSKRGNVGNEIWYRSSVLEYVLIYIVIIVFLIFIIPRDSIDWAMAYTASLISYLMIVLFIYYWSMRTNYENRDMRLVFIIFIFVMLFAQTFHYHTTNDVIALIMLVIAMILLIYLMIRGIYTLYVILLFIPFALISYYIVIQIVE